MRATVGAAGLLALAFVIGCQESGPERNHVSGSVTFQGKPIPYGEVLITPDGQKRNTGAQGIAPIRDGKYDTSASGGKGYGGGPAVVRVTGLTGDGGKLLCEYEFQVDLPRGDAKHDLDVPAQGAPKAAGKEPDI